MAFTLEERWYFSSKQAPRLLERVLANLGITGQVIEEDGEYTVVIRCPDETSVLTLLRKLAIDLAEIVDAGDSALDLSAGFELNYQLLPDWDGPFEWVLEALFDDTEMTLNEWPLLREVADALASRAGGTHEEDLSNDDLVAAQTTWSPPPPIKRSR